MRKIQKEYKEHTHNKKGETMKVYVYPNYKQEERKQRILEITLNVIRKIFAHIFEIELLILAVMIIYLAIIIR